MPIQNKQNPKTECKCPKFRDYNSLYDSIQDDRHNIFMPDIMPLTQLQFNRNVSEDNKDKDVKALSESELLEPAETDYKMWEVEFPLQECVETEIEAMHEDEQDKHIEVEEKTQRRTESEKNEIILAECTQANKEQSYTLDDYKQKHLMLKRRISALFIDTKNDSSLHFYSSAQESEHRNKGKVLTEAEIERYTLVRNFMPIEHTDIDYNMNLTMFQERLEAYVSLYPKPDLSHTLYNQTQSYELHEYNDSSMLDIEDDGLAYKATNPQKRQAKIENEAKLILLEHDDTFLHYMCDNIMTAKELHLATKRLNNTFVLTIKQLRLTQLESFKDQELLHSAFIESIRSFSDKEAQDSNYTCACRKLAAQYEDGIQKMQQDFQRQANKILNYMIQEYEGYVRHALIINIGMPLMRGKYRPEVIGRIRELKEERSIRTHCCITAQQAYICRQSTQLRDMFCHLIKKELQQNVVSRLTSRHKSLLVYYPNTIDRLGEQGFILKFSTIHELASLPVLMQEAIASTGICAATKLQKYFPHNFYKCLLGDASCTQKIIFAQQNFYYYDQSMYFIDQSKREKKEFDLINHQRKIHMLQYYNNLLEFFTRREHSFTDQVARDLELCTQEEEKILIEVQKEMLAQQKAALMKIKEMLTLTSMTIQQQNLSLKRAHDCLLSCAVIYNDSIESSSKCRLLICHKDEDEEFTDRLHLARSFLILQEISATQQDNIPSTQLATIINKYLNIAPLSESIRLGITYDDYQEKLRNTHDLRYMQLLDQINSGVRFKNKKPQNQLNQVKFQCKTLSETCTHVINRAAILTQSRYRDINRLKRLIDAMIKRDSRAVHCYIEHMLHKNQQDSFMNLQDLVSLAGDFNFLFIQDCQDKMLLTIREVIRQKILQKTHDLSEPKLRHLFNFAEKLQKALSASSPLKQHFEKLVQSYHVQVLPKVVDGTLKTPEEYREFIKTEDLCEAFKYQLEREFKSK